MAMFFVRFAVCVIIIIIIIIDKTDEGLNGLCIRAFQFGQKNFDSIRFSLPNRFFRFDSIRQSDKFAAFTLIFK